MNHLGEFRRAHLIARAVIVEGSKVLLAQHRHEGRDPFWCFPGGHVEEGEGLVEAAARELREETGYEVELLDLAFVQDFARRPGPDVAEVFFRGRIRGGELRVHPEPGLVTVEWTEVRELTSRRILPIELARAVADGRWSSWRLPLPQPIGKGRP